MSARGATARQAPAELLVGLALIAAAAWCGQQLSSGAAWMSATTPLVLVAASAALAWWVRRRCGSDPWSTPLPTWYVLVALAASAAATATWWVIDGSDQGVSVGVAAVIAGGPAGLMIAGPLGIWTGNRQAATEGIRFPDTRALDAVARIDTLVLNLTNTVTTGRLTVLSTDPFDPAHDRNLRWFAGALAYAWPGDVGRALTKSAGHGRLSDVEVIDGQGIRGSVDRHPVRVGVPAWIGVSAPKTIWSAVGVEVDGRALGTVTVADDVRTGAPEAVRRLADLGIEPVLLSAGSEATTEHVATAAGITTWHAATPLTGHADVLQRLTDQRRVIAAAGVVQGYAPLHFCGPDASGADAHIYLDDADISRVVRAIELGRSAHRRVARACGLALVVSAAGIAVAVAALVGPIGAAMFAVAGSAVVAVFAAT